MTTDTVRRRWLRSVDVADMLGVSVHTVRSWRLRSAGPPSYRMGKAIRYDRSEVEEWHRSKREPNDGTS